MSKSVLFSLALTIAHALPSGSPFCELNDQTIKGFESKHDTDGGSSTGFGAKFIDEGASYKITLSKTNTPIHGLLMYVTDKSGKHIGEFKEKKGFKFVEGDKCGSKKSTITHQDQTEKTDTEFSWSPSKSDQGPFTLTAVISGMKVPWAKISAEAGKKPQDTKQESVKKDTVTAAVTTAQVWGLPSFLGTNPVKAIEEPVKAQAPEETQPTVPEVKETQPTVPEVKATQPTAPKAPEVKAATESVKAPEVKAATESVKVKAAAESVKAPEVKAATESVKAPEVKAETQSESNATETEAGDATETADLDNDLYFSEAESRGPMFLIVSFMLYGLL